MSSNSGRPGRCAFCGKHLTSTSTPIVAYGPPSAEGKGAFAKLKPLRWRFLTNKGPRSKYMCTACAEKRQVASHQKDQQPVSFDSSWPEGARNSTDVQKPRQREERSSQVQREPGQALKLEHLLEPNDKARPQRRSRTVQQTTQVQPEKRELQPERHTNTPEPPRSEDRRRRSTQTHKAQQEPARRSSVLHPFANHRASRESVLRNRPVSTSDIRARSSSTSKPRAASADTPVRPRKASNGQAEPRRSEKKDARRSQTDQRLSSTADILGMSRSLELPPNYFDRSSAQPAFTAMSAPEHDRLELETQLESPKKNETTEERERRRSASYAHMLVRMRRHYDAVQVDGNHAHPATAPPRRVRADRRAKSVAHRNVNEHAAIENPATFAIDLNYLRAYKDAR